jgi:hypothetical protein
MAKNGTAETSDMGAAAPVKKADYSAAVIQQTFEKAVASIIQDRKLEQLKQGNEKVFFVIDGKAVIAYSNTAYASFDNARPLVFINNKKVRLANINKLLKRNQVWEDDKTGRILSKQYGRDAIAFRPYSSSDNDPKNQAWQKPAGLIIKTGAKQLTA